MTEDRTNDIDWSEPTPVTSVISLVCLGLIVLVCVAALFLS